MNKKRLTEYIEDYLDGEHWKQEALYLEKADYEMILKALKAQPECDDTISRQMAIDEVLAWLKDSMSDKKNGKPLTERLKDLPSVQPEDWIEQNKDRILKAGMEGREIEFRIGGRLFAIREKAQ